MTEILEENVQAESIEVVPDEFETRVMRLLGMIETDPSTRDRMQVEMYLALTDMERMMRTMMESGGPIAMLKAMMGRKSE